MPTSDARLATVEAVVLDIRGDIIDLKHESARTRERLHSLEGTAAAFLQTQSANRQAEEKQYQRLGIRIQVLTVVVAAATILVPIVLFLLSGK